MRSFGPFCVIYGLPAALLGLASILATDRIVFRSGRSSLKLSHKLALRALPAVYFAVS